MKIYAAVDVVAEELGPPWVAKNDSVALRQFNQLMGDVDPSVRKEFKLYCIGEYDKDLKGEWEKNALINACVPKLILVAEPEVEHLGLVDRLGAPKKDGEE